MLPKPTNFQALVLLPQGTSFPGPFCAAGSSHSLPTLFLEGFYEEAEAKGEPPGENSGTANGRSVAAAVFLTHSPQVSVMT